MKIQTLALAFTLGLLSTFSYAGSVGEGIVIEGDSLPIGVSLGDTFYDVENALAVFGEFDLTDGNDSYCEYTRCTYIARNTADEELGRIVVFFERNDASQDFIADQIRWTFDNWITTAGLSLKNMRTVKSRKELREFYPEATGAIVRTRGSSRAVLLRSAKDGITMLSAQYNRVNLNNVSYAYITAPKK